MHYFQYFKWRNRSLYKSPQLSEGKPVVSFANSTINLFQRKTFAFERPSNRKFLGKQDGGGVGWRGVLLSPRIHQEYASRDRSACRTPAESEQEYLTSRKEPIGSCKTQ